MQPKVKFDHQIRLANEHDSRVLVDLWHKLDQSLPPTPFIPDHKYRREFHQALAQQIGSNISSITLVSCLGNMIIGCACGYLYEKPESLNSPVGLIHNVWVEPEFRRKGIARQLISVLEQELAERGAKSHQVSWRNVTAAQLFWQSLGYCSYETVAAKAR
jgi:ribosomal protein S18 acetylase RimI-like enzyme